MKSAAIGIRRGAPGVAYCSLDALRDVAVRAAFISGSRSERRYCALKARSAA